MASEYLKVVAWSMRRKLAPLVSILLSGWPLFGLVLALGSLSAVFSGDDDPALVGLARSGFLQLESCLKMHGQGRRHTVWSKTGPRQRRCLYSSLAPLLTSDTHGGPYNLPAWLRAAASWGHLDYLQRLLAGMAYLNHNVTEAFRGPSSDALWGPDFFLQALLVDDFVATCMTAANCRMEKATGKPKRSSSRRDDDQRTAWASLVWVDPREPERIWHWLEALVVLRWTISLNSEAERPFLVLCDVDTPEEVHVWLKRRHFIPLPVELHPLPWTAAANSSGGQGGRRRSARGRLWFHLWRLVGFERIVYLDADCLVNGDVERLFALPAEVHFAAVARGGPGKEQLDASVMVVTPDMSVYQAMVHQLGAGTPLGNDEPLSRALSASSLVSHDSLWLDLFWHWYSSAPRGGLVRWDLLAEKIGLASVADLCPPSSESSGLAAHRQVAPGGGLQPLAVCLLDESYNFPVSFSWVNQAYDNGLAKSCAEVLADACRPGGVGIRILHWQGDHRKPFDRRMSAPWSRSTLDEIWWEARQAAVDAALEEEWFGAWREDGRCGLANPNAFAREGECNPHGEAPCCNPRTGWCGNTSAHCSCRECLDYEASSRHAGPLFDPKHVVADAPTAAVLVLARMDTLANLRKLARLFRGLRTCHWIVARGSPVLVMHDVPLYGPCAAGLNSTGCLDALGGDWGPFVRFVNVTERFAAPSKFRTLQTVKGAPLSYAVMCEFWASTVFELPEVQDLQYYLRLDSDATITCEADAPDAFGALEDSGAHYGYYLLASDEESVSVGFTQHLRGHLAASGQSSPELEGLERAPLFYNNFEVVNLAYFRTPAVKSYTQAVLDSEGIYLHRWGDAAIRYGQLRAGQGRSLCLSGAYGYCKKKCCMVGAGPCTYPVGGSCAGIGNNSMGLELLDWFAPATGK